MLTSARDLVMLMRTRRLGLVMAWALGLVAVYVALPLHTPVPFRDVVAEPTRALWGLAGCLVALVLDPRFEALERTTTLPIIWRRGCCLSWAVGFCALAAAGSALLNHTHLTYPVRAVCAGSAVAIGVALVGSIDTAVVATFLFVATNWIFGLQNITAEPHRWAVLMVDSPSLGDALIPLVLILLGGMWTLRGAHRDS
ncbi:MAG: hypothetical protein AB7I40_03060 [Nocardioides sp.]